MSEWSEWLMGADVDDQQEDGVVKAYVTYSELDAIHPRDRSEYVKTVLLARGFRVDRAMSCETDVANQRYIYSQEPEWIDDVSQTVTEPAENPDWHERKLDRAISMLCEIDDRLCSIEARLEKLEENKPIMMVSNCHIEAKTPMTNGAITVGPAETPWNNCDLDYEYEEEEGED